jgi:hypothetical protein
MVDKDMMILQYQACSELGVQDPCDGTNPTSHDASQAISIKVEEEAGPMPVPFLKIEVEPEVRCMSLYVHCKK